MPPRFPLYSTRLAATVMLGFALAFPLAPCASAQNSLSQAQLESIGKRIWQSEAAGKVEGLTSWNSGEDFASLGIGHFIWYPAGKRGPFEESFPPLVAYLQQSGVPVPEWLKSQRTCPWPDRASFLRDKNSQRQQDLRKLLAGTVSHQVQFIIQRLKMAAPRMQAAAGANAARVRANMDMLGQTAAGNYAMIDYVNFKGEGLKADESYNGQGWGLLQVLIQMEPVANASDAPRSFSRAAKAVLTRRVENSPAARKERQWLQGWLNRCEGYARQ